MDSPRRFEWTMIENIFDKALTADVLQDPLSWEEFCPYPEMDRFLERWTESHPPAVDEKHEADFYMHLGSDFLCCRPEKKLPREVWIYAVRADDPAMPPELQTTAFAQKEESRSAGGAAYPSCDVHLHRNCAGPLPGKPHHASR